MRLSSPLPHKKARIEIIPLIDIMFFLLASFMMVSLSQTHMKGINVNLPSGPPPPGPPKKDYVSIQVREGNTVYFDGQFVQDDQVLPQLYQLHQANPEIKVSISAEMMALHGDVISGTRQSSAREDQKGRLPGSSCSGTRGSRGPRRASRRAAASKASSITVAARFDAPVRSLPYRACHPER